MNQILTYHNNNNNNMRGYSKMNPNSLTSIDMMPDLDPIKLFEPPAIGGCSSSSSSSRRSLKLISSNSDPRETEDIIHPIEPDDVKGEVFGVILSRKSPPAAGHSHSHRFGHPDIDQHSSSSLHSAVRRAFSMKRSCSASERYCRIHENFLPLSPHHQDGAAPGSASKKKARLANSKLLKVCKRMFGL